MYLYQKALARIVHICSPHAGIRKASHRIFTSWNKITWDYDIIDKYRPSDTQYLLPVITREDGSERRHYQNQMRRINRCLKDIARLTGLSVHLSLYYTHHCWASTMRDMGVNLSIVSKGLGHESLKTTQIYLSSIDMEGVVKANRKLIGKIFRK